MSKKDKKHARKQDKDAAAAKKAAKQAKAAAKEQKAAKQAKAERAQAQAICTDAAPQALGPYSQAMVKGGLVFASGQLGIDPATGRLPEGMAAQTTQAIANLEAVLEAAGSSLDDVVKTTCFVTNLAMFDAFNIEYAKRFVNCPARECVQVAQLPMGAWVEISAIAVL